MWLRCVPIAVWPAAPLSSERRCRVDSSQQTNSCELQLDSHSSRQPSPRIKSEHLSPPMTSSSRDRVTSRGTSPLDRAPSGCTARCDIDDANTGVSDAGVPPCLSSLGYEIECITPVSEEPTSVATGHVDDDLSGLDMLSCIASSQLHEICSTCPRRRFSILDLPLSDFIAAAAADADDGRKTSSSPDVVSAGYNVPSAGDCVVNSETLTRVIHQQNVSGTDSSAEQRSGDVFTAFKVDVGQ